MPSYKIPSDQQIRRAAKQAFQTYNTVSSQQKLKKLVEQHLKKKNTNYHVSPSRLRHLVLQYDLADIEIHSRAGDPQKLLTRCPVCSGSLSRVKNLTIYGGEVTIELRCNSCGYWTGKKKRIPTLYVFHKKSGEMKKKRK